jgi:hypothetical protein
VGGIIKKDLGVFCIAPVVFLPLLLLLEAIIGRPLHPITLIVNHLVIFVFAVAPVMIVEQNEEKCDAYCMISMLPVKKSELVGSKFVLVFFSVALLVGVQCVFLMLHGDFTATTKMIMDSFILNGMVVLVLTGLGYFGIFTLGYTRFLVILGVLSALAGLIPPALIQMKLFDPLKVADWIKITLMEINWVTVSAAVLLSYGILTILSVQVFSFDRKQKDVYFLDI